MLLKHSFIYLVSRIIPSIIGLLAILVYTRLLSPSQYGNYALFITMINFINVIFFQWLRVGLLRHLPGTVEDNLMSFQKTILTGFLLTSIVIICISPIGLIITNDILLIMLVLLNGLILGWFELNQTLYRTLLKPKKYGLITFVKVFVSFVFSCVLIILGLGEKGVFLGIFFGTLLSIVSVTFNQWKVLNASFDLNILKKLLKYGVPLTLTFSMTFIIQFSDRFIIGWLKGPEQAGYYAVAADLSNQTIAMLMMIINLGALPIAIKKYESEGVKEALKQFEQNFILMLGLSLPVVVGGIILSNNIAHVFFSEDYVDSVSVLLPLLLIGTCLSGFKSYYFDQAFQIGNKTIIQIIPVIVAAILSITLNLFLIPSLGASGAAISSISSYFVSLVITWWIGRSILQLPIPFKISTKIVASALIMGFSIFPFRLQTGPWSLIVSIFIGVIVYFLCILLFNVSDSRKILKKLMSNRYIKEKQSENAKQ
ncbi:hypothetical protein BK126_07860 [Paenibacillus sp. FSL H7-0326]|uniref:oligosaccharide flippase family protein n=1 Tax=Paenibacillus sp. FSL H7-0326 TaxID=1921144 RepID=UPI00096E7E59|nr:oligosaccharide flippase family protein [Paenibacillus sp. FSL H7-0326]OMC71933.1 hypothetical protein BK126_07860 [Paenibacillus sp. FSL H7-0326]